VESPDFGVFDQALAQKWLCIARNPQKACVLDVGAVRGKMKLAYQVRGRGHSITLRVEGRRNGTTR
jgi:hypothetical protein